MSGRRRGCGVLAVAAAVLLISCFTRPGPAEPAPAPVSEAGADALVGAYYYPWYYPDRWTHEPVTHTPQLGFYRSDDRAVARQHVRWAKDADLDFFLVSWLSPDGYEDKNFREAVLPELQEGDFRFALLYETPLALNVPAGQKIDLDQPLPDGVKAGERMAEHFDYLAEAYLAHDQYLKHDGKAVVTVYLVRDMANAGPYLAKIRQRLRERGVELYLIADVVYWEPVENLDWALLKGHFDAVTAYNMYHRPQFLKQVRDQFVAADRAAREHGLSLVPNVMPGYDDTPLRGEERVTLNRRRGQFYRDYWDLSAPFVTKDQPFLLVTSFNEWHEGTEIEPSTEFGDAYLGLTRELIGRVREQVKG